MKKQVTFVILLLLGMLNLSVSAYDLKVESWPTGAGSVSGGGTYEEGTRVRLSTSANTGFRFLGWFDGSEKVSQDKSFTYNMPERDVTLTAKYEFHPDSPGDPSMPDASVRYSFKSRIVPEGAGSVNISEGKYTSGSKLNLSVSANTGFVFKGWFDGDELVSSSKSYAYTMPSRNVELTARFEFRPGSPDDPSAVTVKYPLTILREPAVGGSVSPTSGNKYAEGENIRLSASLNSGYVFDGWVDAFGSVMSTSRSHTFVMPASPTTLTARFRFAPGDPGDPRPSTPTRNILYGSREAAYAGTVAAFSVNLENADDVYGVDFDIMLPSGIDFDMERAIPAERAAMHTLAIEPLDIEGGFHLSLVGDECFKGGNGALVKIPVTIPAHAEPGTVYTISILGASIYADDGSQMAVSMRDGQIKVTQHPEELPDSPDFKIGSVSAEVAAVMPEDAVTISWTVTNDGNLDAAGGWSESVYLADASGKRVMLGSVYYDGAGLGVGQTISRSATLTVPRLPGLSGKLNPVVSLMPYLASDEIIQLQSNNTTIGEGFPITLGQRLILTLPETVLEGKDTSIRGQLARSGRWDESESFSLSAIDADSRLTVPENVIILPGQSAAWFKIDIADNGVADPVAQVRLEVSGEGYDSEEAVFTLRDTRLPAIVLSVSPDEITEGESAVLKAKIPYPLPDDLSLNLVSSLTDRLVIPSSLVIPAGETEASVSVTASDNDAVDGHQDMAIVASAPGFENGTEYIMVIDNDMPELHMQLTPSEVNENAGLMAVRGEISRTSNLDKRVTLLLTADRDGQVFFPVDKVVLDRGVASAEFAVGVLDNDKVEGDRDVEITASVFVSSCNCTSVGGHAGSVSGGIRILDNDRPSLELVSNKSVVAEGDSYGVQVTVRRNADLDKALTVALSCDTPDALDMPKSIVIKKGEESVSFKLTAPVNEVADDDRTVVVSAKADGYASSNLWMMITDRTLPDARISGISVSEKEVVAGGEVDVTLSLASTGVVALPAQTCIAIYADGEVTGRVWLQEPLAPGVVKELVRKITLPAHAGVCEIYAVVNPDKAFKEINHSDNHSAHVKITLTSPFKAGVEVSSDRILKGESVKVFGRLDSSSPEGQEVEVYMINDGMRQSEKTVASSDGSFEVSFTPYASQSGHFSVGACCPGENLSEEMSSFEIIDLKRTDGGFVTCEAVSHVASGISIGIKNPCGLPMTGLKAQALNVPDGINVEVKVPGSLKAGERGSVSLLLTGLRASEGSDWERFSVAVTSAEGASLEVPVYWYCRNPKGAISSSLASIEAELPQDETVEYPVTIFNKGAGETGAVEVVLPAWMKCAGPTRLPSLASGEEITFTLLLKPTPEMALNHNVTGQFAVNCENGDGVAIPYKVMPVSNQPAVLAVEACDEYTYNTAEAPKVQGAKVAVINPGTGFTVAEGNTDETGCFLAQLPAGYYRVSVSADKHESWSGTIFLNPGKTNNVTANISFNPISISYSVVPTEVEDEYLIETDVRFEMNVPAPVVNVIAPKRIDGDNMKVGDHTIVNVQVVNEGLMTAFNTSLLLEKDNPEWKFEPLEHADPFDLAPRQVVNIPVRITRIADLVAQMPPAGMKRIFAEDMVHSYRACTSHLAATYEVICGDTIWKNGGAASLAMKACATAATMAAIYSGLSNLMSGSGSHGDIRLPNGGGGGTPHNAYAVEQPVGGSQKFTICDPCDAEKANDMINNFMSIAGGPVGDVWSGMDAAAEEHLNGKNPANAAAEQARDGLISGGLDMAVDGAGDLAGLVPAVITIAKPCSLEDSTKTELKKVVTPFDEMVPKFRHSWQEVFYKEAKLFVEGWQSVIDIYTAVLGDPIWMFDKTPDKVMFMKKVLEYERGTVISDAELAGIKPESVSLEVARAYADRQLNIIDVEKEYGDLLSDRLMLLVELKKMANEVGFDNCVERFQQAYIDYCNEFENLKTNSVCASVGLRFSQSMTMTREAFRGTLEVFNGHDDTPMRDVKLNLTVTDPDGNLATSHEFQINPESISGFKGNLDLMAGWELSAGENGVAEIIFIPTRYAAPDGPLVWDFGGSLTYIDPFTDLEVTRQLQPVSVTVNPTPVLDLTYFLQRDVYSDDPLTPDVVEQSEGAEFALVIHNSGVGDAKNVRLVTQQPQIVDNEKGILLETAFTSSQLNGGERYLALGGSMASDFGDIQAGTSAYAQWWFESSIAGHFTEYEVKATHVSSYGNPDLSLLGDVEIHELIRGITDPVSSDDSPRRVFLANDIVDADDAPDMVYFSDASQETMLGKAIISSQMIDRYTYRLNVQPLSQGWVYGSIEDPTGGRLRLVSITRMSDGKELPVDNFWQTFMTMRDGNKPVHENRMHVAVNTMDNESYRVVFEARPTDPLEVNEISGVPSSTEELLDPVKSVNVSFSKEIDHDTFTPDALRMTRSGERVDLSNVRISRNSPDNYNVEFGTVTDYEGYYVFTVDASRILDADGYEGRNGKSVAWLQKGEPIGAVESIDEDSGNFIISPMPVRNVMSITGKFNQIVNLGIYDTSGTQLGHWTGLKSDFNGSENAVYNTVSVDVRGIPSGVMIVTAVSDSGVIYSRRVLFISD